MNLRDSARAAADTIAERLATPQNVWGLHHRQGWGPQSLAHGAVSVALLHIERARTDQGPWQRADDWLAFALHAADRPGRYARPLDTLDRYVTTAIRDRLAEAHARMDRDIHTDILREILTYLVRLTEPIKHDGEVLPGWWSHLSPSGTISPDYPEGHANNGVAHGIGGPLAVLSLAARRGITVDSHLDSITRILTWLDHWQQDGPAGPWWPYWITREQLRSGTTGPGPSHLSCCYDTAGFARAQQLAALALKDPARQHTAEFALLRAITDPGQLEATVDVSLCHGFAGLAHITQLTAADTLTPGLTECLPRLLAPITDTAPGTLADSLINPPSGGDIRLLEGAAGTALALNAFPTGTPSASGWDT
ncbi:lanthionine synthetase C family protein [Streptomyces sp. NPDC004976]